MKISQKFIFIVIGAIILTAGILLLDRLIFSTPQTRLNAMSQKSSLSTNDLDWLYRQVEKAYKEPDNQENLNLAAQTFEVISHFVLNGQLKDDSYILKVLEKMKEVFKEPRSFYHMPLRTFLRQYSHPKSVDMCLELYLMDISRLPSFVPGPLKEKDILKIRQNYVHPDISRYYKIDNINREPKYLIPVLHKFLGDENQRVRYRAAITLSVFRDTLAIPVLEEIVLKYLYLEEKIIDLSSSQENSGASNVEKLAYELDKVIVDPTIEKMHYFVSARFWLFQNGDPPSVSFIAKYAQSTQDTSFRKKIMPKLILWRIPFKILFLENDTIGFVIKNEDRNIPVIYEDKIKQWNKW